MTALRLEPPTTSQAAEIEALRRRAERDCRCHLCGACFARMRDESAARPYVKTESASDHNRWKGSY
ncbi:MAG: hypothetical protein WC211_00655 [Dehalococcoidia bacterium]